MGGLGSVQLARQWSASPAGRGRSACTRRDPVLACLGSQLAGWQLTVGSGKDRPSNALGSGRAARSPRKEALFDELGYRDERRRRVPGAGGREAPAAGADREGRDGLRASRPAAHADPDSDAAASRARCRSSPACSRWRCTSCMSCASPRTRVDRRHGHGATAAAGAPRSWPPWAAPTTPSSMAASCSSSSPVRTATPAKLAQGPAERRLARLRPAVRGDLQVLQRRLLRHGPAAVQPGAGHGDGARQRPRTFHGEPRRGLLDRSVRSMPRPSDRALRRRCRLAYASAEAARSRRKAPRRFRCRSKIPASRSAAAVTGCVPARFRRRPARRRVRAHDLRRQLRAGDHAAGRAACSARARRARASTTRAPSSAASTNP